MGEFYHKGPKKHTALIGKLCLKKGGNFRVIGKTGRANALMQGWSNEKNF